MTLLRRRLRTPRAGSAWRSRRRYSATERGRISFCALTLGANPSMECAPRKKSVTRCWGRPDRVRSDANRTAAHPRGLNQTCHPFVPYARSSSSVGAGRARTASGPRDGSANQVHVAPSSGCRPMLRARRRLIAARSAFWDMYLNAQPGAAPAAVFAMPRPMAAGTSCHHDRVPVSAIVG